jgi:hypothetical protein
MKTIFILKLFLTVTFLFLSCMYSFSEKKNTKNKSIYITIQAENGSVRQIEDDEESTTWLILPDNGWEISSIIYNGLDITNKIDMNNRIQTPHTNENTNLIITFELAVNEYIIQYNVQTIHSDF